MRSVFFLCCLLMFSQNAVFAQELYKLNEGHVICPTLEGIKQVMKMKADGDKPAFLQACVANRCDVTQRGDVYLDDTSFGYVKVRYPGGLASGWAQSSAIR